MRLETWQAPPGDRIPNHPSFAVLVYHDVEAATAGPDAARALFASHGWGGSLCSGSPHDTSVRERTICHE